MLGRRFVWIAIALALSGPLAAQGLPAGWLLDRMNSNGNIHVWLAYYGPDGMPTFIMNCEEGSADLLVTAYLDEQRANVESFSMSSSAHRHEIKIIDSTTGVDLSAAGFTQFTPELFELLSSNFAIEIDGQTVSRYSINGAKDKLKEIYAACSAEAAETQ